MFFNAQRCIHLCMPCIPSHTKYPTIEMRPQQRAYVVALVVETHADPIPKYNILLMSFELLAPSSSSSSLILRGLCLVFFCPAMLLLWCISLRQNFPLNQSEKSPIKVGHMHIHIHIRVQFHDTLCKNGIPKLMS